MISMQFLQIWDPKEHLHWHFSLQFTGCDTCSSFFLKGKDTCYAAWMSQSERDLCVINACLRGDFTPFTILCDAFQCAEILAISFYDKNSEHVTVHEARVTMATQKKFDFEKLPPTQAALLQHTNRAFFQARIWLQSLRYPCRTFLA